MLTVAGIHTVIRIPMITDLALLRLLHLVSPTLPIGSFTYSQGIEWAVECGWVTSPADLQGWLTSQLHSGMAQVDIPILQRLYHAIQAQDVDTAQYWVDTLNASRETSELLLEEKNRGRALTDLLIALEIPCAAAWKPWHSQSQAAAFALAYSPATSRLRVCVGLVGKFAVVGGENHSLGADAGAKAAASDDPVITRCGGARLAACGR